MGQGFFNLGPTPKIEKPRKAPKRAGCSACGLDQSGKEEPWWGDGNEGILVLGEAPKNLASLGGPFKGKEASPFWDMEGKRQFSKDIEFDMIMGYAVACPPDGNKLDAERSQSCKGRLTRMIQEKKPRVIIAMGPAAIQALIWDRIGGRIGKGTQATDFIGKCIPDRELNAWIIPTYGLEFLSWQYDDKTGDIRDRVPLMQFQQHLRKAWLVRNKAFPEIPDNIETTQDPSVASTWLRTALSEAKEVTLDYETTGIKPHREGHRIVCASIAWEGPDGPVGKGFQWYGDDVTMLHDWEQLMTSPRIKKTAHKNDFEIGWTRERAGFGNGPVTYWPGPWGWDTCLGAHCINNEGKVGLKFHAYCELGVIGYDEHVDRYITQCPRGELEKHGKNAFNHLQNGPIPWDDLLYYCTQDSLFSWWLQKHRQEEELDAFQMKGFELFMEGTDVLSRIHANGLPFDMEKAKEAKDNLSAEIASLGRDIANSDEIKVWEKVKGVPFNAGSNDQLKELLYELLEIPPPGDKKNVQEATLSKIDSPFVVKLLEQRKLVKLRDTFLTGIIREAVWNEKRQLWLVRPFFNLSSGSEDETGGPRTFRSSSDSPNFQNIPKRWAYAKKLIRSLFVAPPGYKWKEYDYTGVEVTGSACYHKDPQMIKYLVDPTTDMHRDTCMDLFFRTLTTFSKAERQGAKNGYVFPTFYGATPNSMGPAMWEDMSQETREHIRAHAVVKYWDFDAKREKTIKGIKTIDQWMKHVKNVDKKFWNVRFKVYGQWKKDEWERLQQDGFLDTFTGFRCFGPLPYTSATNRRIQGSSFHILLQSLIWEYWDMEKAKMKSMIVGQIHDAKIALVHEDEEEAMDALIKYNGAERIRKEWDWIVVPLKIEAEASKVGETWADMEEVGAL